MPTFYRIVRNNPPTRAEFLSDRERGKRRPDDPALAPLWDGLSMYATEAQARRKARRVPFLGRFVAAVDVPEGGPIRYERTLPSQGHHIVWGDPQVLLDRVRSVVAVDRSRMSEADNGL